MVSPPVKNLGGALPGLFGASVVALVVVNHRPPSLADVSPRADRSSAARASATARVPSGCLTVAAVRRGAVSSTAPLALRLHGVTFGGQGGRALHLGFQDVRVGNLVAAPTRVSSPALVGWASSVIGLSGWGGARARRIRGVSKYHPGAAGASQGRSGPVFAAAVGPNGHIGPDRAGSGAAAWPFLRRPRVGSARAFTFNVDLAGSDQPDENGAEGVDVAGRSEKSMRPVRGLHGLPLLPKQRMPSSW